MIDVLIQWAALSMTLMGAAVIMQGVTIRSWRAAVAAAATFGLANVLLGWLLTFLVKVIVFLPNIFMTWSLESLRPGRRQYGLIEDC